MLKFIKLNFTAVSKNCKKSSALLLLFLIIMVLSAVRAGADEEILLVQEKKNFLTLEKGALFYPGVSEPQKVALPEDTRGVLGKGEKIYFVVCPAPVAAPSEDTEKEDKSPAPPVCSAGLYSLKDAQVTVQWPLSGLAPGSRLLKLFAFENIFYILSIDEKDNGEGSLHLVRLNMNSGNAVYRSGVYDFLAEDKKTFLVEKDSRGFVLNINDHFVPLTLSERPVIQGFYNNRFLIVKSNKGKELVDTVTLRNIYAWSGERGPLVPVSANLLVAARDVLKKETGQEDHVFYKVFVDGRDEGRTATGMARLDKSFEVMVEPGQYHVIKLERWHLNQKRRSYRRANNRLQPRTVKLFIPSKRIIRLSVTFDGTNHEIVSETVME